MTLSDSVDLPVELVSALVDHYTPAGLTITGATREAESAEYDACQFTLNGQRTLFRVAKTTPTKIGQFVTLWKRPTPDAEIAPFDAGDGIAFAIIDVADVIHRGQFIFDLKTLVARGVFSLDGQGGKRAIRVYPPWTSPTAKDAIRTQNWQLQHFVSFDRDSGPDLRRLLTPRG